MPVANPLGTGAMGVCANDGCLKPGIYACSKCGVKAYCSQACQKAHWPKHKAECKQLAATVVNPLQNKAPPFGSGLIPPAAPGMATFPTMQSMLAPPMPTMPLQPQPMGSFAFGRPMGPQPMGPLGGSFSPAAPAAGGMGTCAAPGCSKTGVYMCSGCGKIAYCSQECQKRHWPSHKAECKRR